MADAPQPMEDILASIRRIIAEEPSPLQAPAGAVAEIGDDVLELGDAPEPAPPLSPAPVIGPPAPQSDRPRDGLLSDRSEAQSRQALAALASLTVDPAASENTLDGLVREMLRPMVKQWLDANLPDLVERMVAREIARLGR